MTAAIEQRDSYFSAAGRVANLVASVDNGISLAFSHVESDSRSELPQLRVKVLKAEQLSRVLITQRAVVIEHTAGSIAQAAGKTHSHIATSLPVRMLPSCAYHALRVEITETCLVEGIDETEETVVSLSPL